MSIVAKRLYVSGHHLVRSIGLSLGDIVLNGDPAPSPLKGKPPNFRPMSVVAKRLDG